MENLTIRKDDQFLALCNHLNKDPETLAEKILTRGEMIMSKDNAHIEGDDRGRGIIEIIMEMEFGHSLQVLAAFLTGRSDSTVCELIQEARVWGVENDCPECGAASEFYDADVAHGRYMEEDQYSNLVHQCTNCFKTFSPQF